MRSWLALGLFLVACGHEADSARRVILAADQVLIQAADSFADFDRAHQIDLATHDRAKELLVYRQEREKVLVLVDKLRETLIATPILIGLAERGIAKESQVNTRLLAIWEMILQLQKYSKAMGFQIPLLALVQGEP